MIEERKYPRKIANRHIALYDNESKKLIGCLIDLNVAGMRIMCGKELELGTTRQFIVALPLEIENQKELLLTAQTVWCNVSSDPGFYSVGLKFQDLDVEVEKILLQLLETDSFEKIASFSLL